MAMTLEQERAANAWQCAQQCSGEYSKLAKGVPALIMNSGLIQVLAFLHEKGKEDKSGKSKNPQHQKLGHDLCQWLGVRFEIIPSNAQFDAVMNALIHNADPQTFQDITAEAMAWLRWLRQIAPARSVDKAEQE